MGTKERMSNIELLRIMSIIMIVLMHGIGCAFNTNNDINRLSFTFVNAFCNMGVTVFVVISGFFGIRFKISSAVRLWLMLFVYSLLIYVYKVWGGGLEFSTGGIINVMTPVSSVTWWFMTCYFVIFCLSPFLNMILECLSKRRVQILLIILALFFVIFPTFLHHSITNDYGKGLPNFLLAYLIGQYIHKYKLPNFFVANSGLIFFLCGIVIFLVNFFTKNLLLFSKDNNLFIIVGAISLFVWTTKHSFRSKSINYIAGYAFPLYLMNSVLLTVVVPTYKIYVNSNLFLPHFFLAQVVITMFVFAIEVIRRILTDRFIWDVSNKLDKSLTKYINF